MQTDVHFFIGRPSITEFLLCKGIVRGNGNIKIEGSSVMLLISVAKDKPLYFTHIIVLEIRLDVLAIIHCKFQVTVPRS